MWGERYPARKQNDKVISESVESFGEHTQLYKCPLTEVVREDDIQLRSELRGRKTWIEHSRKGRKP